MGTLNQYASRIAHLVNQPDNHVLKERVKDMIKTMFANRIRQSVSKHGIDDILKLTYSAGLDWSDNEYNNIPSLCTDEYIFKPVRIESDAPFMSVTSKGGIPIRYENSSIAAKCRKSGRQTHFPTGSSISYTYVNNKIHIYGEGDIFDDIEENGIYITSIFENPDEVLAVITETNADDIALPLPDDMLEDIIYTILKVEFNMYPKDIDIKINGTTPSTTGTKQKED